MKHVNEPSNIHQDPFGLRDLSWQSPSQDGWPAIRQALESHRLRQYRRRRMTGWLAAAASVLLTVFVLYIPHSPEPESTQVATSIPGPASVIDDSTTLESLIGLSQTLEQQLREMRGKSSAMPADSAIYIAELEDLVALVDRELSYTPDSLNLWGQRVNLLLDLAQIYQQPWEANYGRMASL